jgi:hypothetical protein
MHSLIVHRSLRSTPPERLLHDEDSDVRTAAAYALGELGDPVATGALVALLRDPERNTFMVAREAILALGVLRDAESVSGFAHDRELSGDLRLMMNPFKMLEMQLHNSYFLECSVRWQRLRIVWDGSIFGAAWGFADLFRANRGLAKRARFDARNAAQRIVRNNARKALFKPIQGVPSATNLIGLREPGVAPHNSPRRYRWVRRRHLSAPAGKAANGSPITRWRPRRRSDTLRDVVTIAYKWFEITGQGPPRLSRSG